MASARAYIGSFTSAGGHGIRAAALDPRTGALTPLGATDAVTDPSYLALAPGGEILYAVSETDDGAVAALSVRGDVPELLAPSAPVHGSGPTHLALVAGQVLTANYGSGSVSCLPLGADAAPRAGHVLQHRGAGPDPDRQDGPHAHQVLAAPGGGWILTVDLGTDTVAVCALLDGTLDVRREVALRPGSGPRHLAFHPDGDTVYVLNELAPTLTVCHWDPVEGVLTPGAEVPVLPAEPSGDAYPSEVVVAPDGRFVWTATRGQDVISVLAVTPEADGGPGVRLVTTVDCGGHWPRDLALHPSGRFLYAANERSGDVTWFDIDPDTGIPRRGGSVDALAASCVVFG
ncbi:lactonase family protein [Streptomyces boluensis]|uniref:Beta-propeller fold lactonase family protein n=1 Tax=Streptomyces boluensis TaxID=1775135 RepID=A0A964XIP5_9ACTN|nr:lactonase family protein [Streptomyces boluensis]NBE50260.1 beta-propeller fold lactonase family protein [Streptomyces boluensis]